MKLTSYFLQKRAHVFFLFLVALILFANVAFSQCDTGTAPTYSSSCAYEYFTSITASGPSVISTISAGNSSCTVTYIDDFSQGVIAPAGATVTLNCTRTSTSTYTAWLSVYVDINHDGIFQASELVGSTYRFISGVNSYAYNFTIPTAGITTGVNLPMRVFLTETSATGPCNGTYGQTYDFYLKVCPTVNITLSPTSSGSFCKGSTGISFTASGAGAGGTYTWAPALGLSATTGAAVTATPTVSTVYTITGTQANGCPGTTTASTTVNPLPTAYTVYGTSGYCAGTSGSDVELGNSQTGITYQLYDGSTSIGGTVAGVTGVPIVFGTYPAGTYTVLATNPITGCTNNMTGSAIITLDPLPDPISGTTTFCSLYTTTLTDATSGGAWSSSNTSVATVDVSSGIVSGVAGGTSLITYSIISTGCYDTTTVTVNSLSAITGTEFVCMGSVIALSDATTGGAWNSSNTSVANVDGFGNISPLGQGTTTVSYSLLSGCVATAIVTVNPLPGIITGTMTVCVNSTATLTDSPGGGTWTSSIGSVGTIGSVSGVVTGIGSGVTNIVYTLPTGCSINGAVTVNALPTGITGTDVFCMGSITSLTDFTGGGVWSSSNAAVGTVSGTGIVTPTGPGTATITYSLLTGCYASAIITVNPLPSTITGVLDVCKGLTTGLTDSPAGGSWSSGVASVATIGSSSGVVSGIGSGVTGISYTLPTGCAVGTSVTVNSLPVTITGSMNACVGLTTALTDITGGGTWISSNTAVGTVGSTTGIVTGITAGTTTITYEITSTGCIATTVATVNSLPSTITGNLIICNPGTTLLSDLPAGGTWTSSNSGVASVGTGTGLVTSLGLGTTTITYTLNTGCIATATVTVSSVPSSISGTLSVCPMSSTTLTDASGIGTWSSPATNITIGSTTGTISGLSAGTAEITFTQSSGCYITAVVTVNPQPNTISGTLSVCPMATTTLSDAGGGTWISNLPATATVGSSSGIVAGVSAGTAVITYALPTTCFTTTTVSVYPSPATITGTMNVCSGSTTVLTDISASGTWSSSNGIVATVGSSGFVMGNSAGTAMITYALPTTCVTTTIVTVNPIPSNASGTMSVCVNATASLSDIGGGTWSISPLSTATIGLGTGIVTGIAAGTAVVTYTLPTGCVNTNAAVVTVDPLPSPISGVLHFCPGATTALSDGGIGVWSSSNTLIAAVGSATGVVSGVTSGSATISYTLTSTGCIARATVTVNALAPAITGSRNVCLGFTTALTDIVTGGTWASSTPATASVGSNGIVSGNLAGTSVITYTPPAGCPVTDTVTVNAPPTAILGTTAVCPAGTTSLSDLTGGGTWNSSDAHAAIGSSSGTVTGVSAGTAIITYTLNTGCYTTTIVTVNPLPSAIEGNTIVCYNLATLLSDTTLSALGTWSSSAPATASVVSGLVTGNAFGTATITYMIPTGCFTTAIVVVNPLPPSISGIATVCVWSTTNLTDSSSGTWSSSNITVAPVSLASGVVSGFSVGTAIITFTSSLGCTRSEAVTVNGLPGAISGTFVVCPGLTTSLSDTSIGSWSSTTTAIATITSSGIVTGIATGTSGITFTNAAGCIASAVVTVGAYPPGITGALQVCVDATTTLSDPSSGGTWSAGSTNVTVNATSGVVTGVSAGTAMVTYTNTTGCIITAVLTVNPLPSIVTGSNTVCVGSAITLSATIGGGSWSSSGLPGIISLGGTSGIVTGVSTGTASITYTLPTGCIADTMITAEPLPSSISGPHSLCNGTSITLTDITTGGTWSVSAASAGVATIDPLLGVLSGSSAGTATVSYILSTGCFVTTIITINPLPANISGTPVVCVGTNTLLTDATGGGTWSSSNNTAATIGISTGLVSGISSGTPVITYKLPTGCVATTALTVNPLPSPVTGNRSVCLGATSTLSDIAGGGTWSIGGSSSVATVGIFSGIVSGFALGTAVVTYTLPTGCLITSSVTVNPYPKAIMGSSGVCMGYTVTLSDSTAGGTWASSNASTATVNTFSGVVTGITAGLVFVSYTLPTGCSVTLPVTVNPLFPILGNAGVCVGSVNMLSDAAGGGTWSGGSTLIATVGASSGAVTGIASGNTIITYMLSTGCAATIAVSVNPQPHTYDVTGGGSYCAGGTGVHIGLNGSDTGVSYQLYEGTSLTSILAGTGLALDFGPFATPATYTVVATNTATGCSLAMTGSATVNAIFGVPVAVNLGALPGTTVCTGTSVLFNAAPTNGGTAPVYTWYVNSISVATGTSATYSYVPNNGDVVAVKLTSNLACVSPDSSISSLVMTATSGILPSVSLTVSPGDSVCAGSMVTITPIPVNGGTPTYVWMKNGIMAGTATPYVFTPVEGDNVYCMMTSSISCALPASVYSSNNINMNVPPVEVPVVTITGHPGAMITPGATDTLVASVISTGVSYTYQWSVNGSAIAGATTDMYISSSFANGDIVSCEVTAASFCGTASRSGELTITYVYTTGVQQAGTGTSDIRLVPNPNNGLFSIVGTLPNNNESITIQITDMLGRVVYETELPAGSVKINKQIDMGGNIANGMYVVSLRCGEVNKVIHFVVGQ